MQIAQAFVEVRPDTAKFGRDLDKEVTGAGTSAAKKLKDALQGAFVVKGFLGLKDAASDLNEAVNVTGLIFDKSKGKIDEFAKNAARGLGQSERAAREATGQIGGLLQNLGFAEEASADWSIKLTSLASDLGSAFNKDPAEAVLAIGSALRGETEPIRAFNVQLSDQVIRQKAVDMQLASTTASVNTHGRAQAALALIMEQTKVVAGDFANTSTEAANAERVANAVRENSAASMGKAFLPAYKAAVGVVTNLGEAFGSLPGPIQSAVVAGVGIAALIGPAKTAGGAVKDLATGMFGAGTAGRSMASSIAGIGFGPFAAGLGIAAVGLALFINDQQKASRLAGEFEAALRGAGDAAQDNAKRLIISKLTTDSFTKAFDEAGITIDQATRAIIGGRDASVELERQLVKSGLSEHAGRLGDLQRAYEAASGKIDRTVAAEKAAGLEGDKAAGAADNLSGALTGVAGSGQDAADALDKVAEAQQAVLSSGIDYERSLLSLEDANQQVVEAQKALASGGGGVARSQKDVAAAARAVEDAQRGVETAHRRVEDAQRGIGDAARGVEVAMRSQADAARSVVDAQERITDGARRLVAAQGAVADRQKDVADRARELDKILHGYGVGSDEAADAAENLDDRQRDLRRSQLSLTDAQKKLRDMQSSGTATADDLAGAQLDVEDAQDRLEEATKRVTEAQKDLSETTNGVAAGSDKAKDAQQKLKDAQDKLEEANRNVEQATKDQAQAQRDLTDAQRGVIDAGRGVEEAHRNVERAARDLGDAERGVRDAVREVRDAQEKQSGSSDKTSGSVKSRAELERDLKNAVLDQKQAYLDSAQAFVDRAVDVAAASGQTLTAQQRTDLFKTKLIELAGTLKPDSPLRKDLLAFAGEIKAIPDQKTVRVSLIMDAANDAARRIIGGVFGGSGDGPGNIGAASTAAQMAGVTIGAMGGRITSGYRTPAQNAAAGGSPTSYHVDANNPAQDIGGSNLPGVFAFLNDNYGDRVRELIYGHTMVRKGKKSFYAPNDHWDHVHVAHEGGIVDRSWPTVPGLRSDERPAVLQVGETVTPKGGRGGDTHFHLTAVSRERVSAKEEFRRMALLRPATRTA